MHVCALTLAKSPTARMVFVVCAASSRVGDRMSACTLRPRGAAPVSCRVHTGWGWDPAPLASARAPPACAARCRAANRHARRGAQRAASLLPRPTRGLHSAAPAPVAGRPPASSSPPAGAPASAPAALACALASAAPHHSAEPTRRRQRARRAAAVLGCTSCLLVRRGPCGAGWPGVPGRHPACGAPRSHGAD